ncbi:hypothetical protein TRFO_25089 [Tritrichomonas foetus]|uniref:Uncharacterized protein n=1 Tax=Tritrichomonas foetus TaxID=1144522 RepID=A0A1J4K5Z8_9EUKA|nr:hypothetical protein TRFO_25089 [Tritrichomonas foetus]|eukprot:OHT06839.1 hypothetical protein TRFO_25089 [Tritrichomonas foetus]
MSISKYLNKNTCLSLYVPKRPLQLNMKLSPIGGNSALPKLRPNSPPSYPGDDELLENEIMNDSSSRKSPLKSEGKNDISDINPDQNRNHHSKNDEPIVDNELPAIISFSANQKVIIGEIDVKTPPSLPSISDSNFVDVWKEKINVCNLIFDFSQNNTQVQGKKIKLRELRHFHAFFRNHEEASLLKSECKEMLFNMIYRNIFEQNPFVLDYESNLDVQQLVDQSWPHLSLVYKILNDFLFTFPDFIKPQLVEKAIRLMNLPDINERDCLACFALNYYKLHPEHFEIIWKYICTALSNVISGIFTSYSVHPLLAFIVSLFINSRSSTKPYLRDILFTHLLPLYHHDNMCKYSSILTSTVYRAIENHTKLQLETLKYLIKSFPRQNGKKQIQYINAITVIIRPMKGSDIRPISQTVISFVGECVRSPNAKLVDATLQMLNGKYVPSVFTSNSKQALTILYHPLTWCFQSHWNKNAREQAEYALSVVKRLDTAMSISIIKATRTTLKKVTQATNEKCNEQITNWALISREAAQNDHDINLTNILQSVHLEFLSEEKCQVSRPMVSSRAPVAHTPLSMAPSTRNSFSQKYYKYDNSRYT